MKQSKPKLRVINKSRIAGLSEQPLFAANPEAALPLLSMIGQAQLSIEDLLGQLSGQFIEQLLVLSAQSVAGTKHPGRHAGDVRWHGSQSGVVAIGHPHFAVLARVDGTKGYHDVLRHPEGRYVPGLVLFRWDAPLFFANAEIFRERVHRAVRLATTPTRRVVVASDAITDVDVTAADTLTTLHGELRQQGIELWFAGMKGPVKDRLQHYGTLDLIGHGIFCPTVGQAVNVYRAAYRVDWKDWDEV